MKKLIKSIKRDLKSKSDKLDNLSDKMDNLNLQLNTMQNETEVAIVGYIISVLVIFDILYILFYLTK